MTGPDDSVKPEDLQPLADKYPFVEFGILVSSSHNGEERFPSTSWQAELDEFLQQEDNFYKLSLHMCGKWVRDLLIGRVSFHLSMLRNFERIQLNFHAENTPCQSDGLAAILDKIGKRGEKQFIFQIDGSGGNKHLDDVWDSADRLTCGVSAVPLFDVSGGAGISPAQWPSPQWMDTDSAYCYHGYAGGLGPHNLDDQIQKIAEVVDKANPKTKIWIDMETHIRSNNDKQFDLEKVAKCLEIASKYVT